MVVKVKKFMHSEAWHGLRGGEDSIDAEPHRLFALSPPTFVSMPSFTLKTVDTTVIALIDARITATRDRLEASYSMGKRRTRFKVMKHV